MRNHRAYFLRSLRLETGVVGAFLLFGKVMKNFFEKVGLQTPKKSAVRGRGAKHLSRTLTIKYTIIRYVRYAGDNDELYFRDYMNEHPNVAKEYEALKLKLWKKYEHNRDAYTDAKTDFIHHWTQEA